MDPASWVQVHRLALPLGSRWSCVFTYETEARCAPIQLSMRTGGVVYVRAGFSSRRSDSSAIIRSYCRGHVRSYNYITSRELSNLRFSAQLTF